MVLVAVAGGTSPTLGRSIVKAILAQGKHNVVILSRQSSTEKLASKYDAPIRYVDYESTLSLTDALQGVHTVISVLKVVNPDQMIAYHSNLLDACLRAGIYLRTKSASGMYARKEAFLMALNVPHFNLEAFSNILDKGSRSHRLVPVKKKKNLSGLDDNMMSDYMDIANHKLVIPINSSGHPVAVTMTHLNDIGTFLASALDLPTGSWNGHMGIRGCTFTFADAADIINNKTQAKVEQETISAEGCDERIRKFDAVLAKGFKVEALIGKMVAQMVKCMCLEEVGVCIMPPDLNRLCPDVMPIQLEEYLLRAWGRK